MTTFLTFILLQINLFGNNSEAIHDSKVYIEKTYNNEVTGLVKIGHSGQFLFSNLDPGNYNIVVEIPEDKIEQVDKKLKDKYETDIEIAYNSDKQTLCWHHPSKKYIAIEFNKDKNIADDYFSKFERNQQHGMSIEKIENNSPNTNSQSMFFKLGNKKNDNKITVLQITVNDEYGTIGGSINSISQKEFYRLVVGKEDAPLETLGEVEVLRRAE